MPHIIHITQADIEKSDKNVAELRQKEKEYDQHYREVESLFEELDVAKDAESEDTFEEKAENKGGDA